MTSPLRLIQISDFHLSADPARLYRGQSADSGLVQVLEKTGQWMPDRVLATGDLSEDASIDSYQRIAGLLDRLDAPLLTLPGNHDDKVITARFLPGGPWGGPLVVRDGEWQIVMLDSVLPGRIEGRFNAATLLKLDRILAASGASHSLVALHHQPVPVGSPWIDRYALQSAGDFWAVIDRAPGVRAVIWGHVHQGFKTSRNGISLLGAPSTAANSMPGTQRFELDPQGPACRWLKLHANGEVDSGILRANALSNQAPG